ncbi:RNA polymerase sigma factor [Spirosoma arcticum]
MIAKSIPTKASDELLLYQYLEGNREAMGTLYQRYFKKVYYRCFSLCRDSNDAYDLAQDSLLKAFEQAHTFQERSSFATWLFVITNNHCRAYFNQKKRARFSSLEDVYCREEGLSTSPSDRNLNQDEQESLMFTLLNKISEQERNMLYLKYCKGESIETLQVRFNLTASAVKMRLKRSKEKLNAQYDVHLSSV